mmetsp:Transcript_8699/g.21915  ORF Transcript_8699/g.21915 Transcript_8699/m.21915 type:complete len:420 (-) Transcript_8699:198-1457(-)
MTRSRRPVPVKQLPALARAVGAGLLQVHAPPGHHVAELPLVEGHDAEQPLAPRGPRLLLQHAAPGVDHGRRHGLVRQHLLDLARLRHARHPVLHLFVIELVGQDAVHGDERAHHVRVRVPHGLALGGVDQPVPHPRVPLLVVRRRRLLLDGGEQVLARQAVGRRRHRGLPQERINLGVSNPRVPGHVPGLAGARVVEDVEEVLAPLGDGRGGVGAALRGVKENVAHPGVRAGRLGLGVLYRLEEPRAPRGVGGARRRWSVRPRPGPRPRHQPQSRVFELALVLHALRALLLPVVEPPLEGVHPVHRPARELLSRAPPVPSVPVHVRRPGQDVRVRQVVPRVPYAAERNGGRAAVPLRGLDGRRRCALLGGVRRQVLTPRPAVLHRPCFVSRPTQSIKMEPRAGLLPAQLVREAVYGDLP